MVRARQEAGNIFEDQQGNVEGITEAHKASSLGTSVNIQDPRKVGGLVGHNPDGASRQSGKAHHHVFGKLSMYFHKRLGVDQLLDHFTHVIGLLRTFRNNRIQARTRLVPTGIGQERNPVFTVLRDIGQKLLKPFNGGTLVRIREMGYAALRCVGTRSSQVFGGDFLVGHGFDDIRAGHEHVARSFHHADEIGQCRGIHSASRTGAHDEAQLRDDPRSPRVPVKDVGIAAQGYDALLDPSPTRIIEANHRAAILKG